MDGKFLRHNRKLCLQETFGEQMVLGGFYQHQLNGMAHMLLQLSVGNIFSDQQCSRKPLAEEVLDKAAMMVTTATEHLGLCPFFTYFMARFEVALI